MGLEHFKENILTRIYKNIGIPTV